MWGSGLVITIFYLLVAYYFLPIATFQFLLKMNIFVFGIVFGLSMIIAIIITGLIMAHERREN
jgi:hypothetical protein